jgi:O-antigen/teichoic acid export membrane protein
VGIFTIVIKPKVLTSEEIGILSTIVSLTLVTQIFTFGGSLSVIMKFYPKYKNTEELKKFISSVIITSYILLFFAIMFLFLSKSVIISYYKNNSLNDYFIFIPLYLILSHTTEICERLSRVLFVSVESNVIRNIYFKFINFGFLIFMFFEKTDFKTYLIFFLILNLLTVGLLIRLSIRNLKLKWTLSDLIPDFSFIKQFLNYAFFMMVSSLAGVASNNVDKIMIGHYLSFGQTGIYSVAMALTTVMNIIFDSFSRITQPQLSECIEDNDKVGLKKTYLANLYNNIYFGVIAFVLITLLSLDILSFFGKEYQSGYYVIIIICIGQLVNLSAGMCGEIISLSTYYKFDFYSRAVQIFVIVVSNAVFIPAFGITGAAVATTSNFIIYDLIKIFYAYKKFGVHPFTAMTLKIYSTGLVVGVMIFLFKHQVSAGFTSIILISFFSFLIYDLILGYVFGYEYSISKKIIKKYGILK